jgi:Protein of unknown function (DUF3105)
MGTMARAMPPKPRVSAPKRAPLDSAARRQRLILYALAASGLVALALVVVVFAATAGGGGTIDEARVRSAAEAAGCTYTSKPAVKADHSLQPDGRSPKWNTVPATSGPHHAATAVWGAYSEPLQQARVVHNLEHGGVFIEYGRDVPASTVQELRSFYDDHTRGTLLAPQPSLGKKIAVGAWTAPEADPDNGTGHLLMCEKFDENAFSAFFDELQFKGRERFPSDTLLPGM